MLHLYKLPSLACKMKQIRYTKKDLLKKIKEKKELSGLADIVIEEAVKDYTKKYNIQLKTLSTKQIRTIVKEIRAELRLLTGRFQKTQKKKIEFFKSNQIKKLLETHTSTTERLDFYPELKKIISSLKVKSILDLGCGLNPLVLANSKIIYYASDIKEDELSLIKLFFEKNNFHGRTFFYDLRKIKNNLPKTDLCLIFKVLDILQNNHTIAEKILKKVHCKYFLISFPTKKLSGKPMSYPRRIWFERILTNLNLHFKKFSTSNEVFYLIHQDLLLA